LDRGLHTNFMVYHPSCDWSSNYIAYTINEAYHSESEATMNGRNPCSSHESNFSRNRLLLFSLSSYCLYCFGSLYAVGNVWFSLSENAPRLRAYTTFHNAPYRQFITRCADSSTLQQLAFFTYDSARHV